MIAWGEILADEQILNLVEVIRGLPPMEGSAQPGAISGAPSFANDVMSLFEVECTQCHGAAGGWDASSYDAVMTSGENAPSVIPGDAENSLLAQKMLGTHSEGIIMPPAGKLPDDQIQIIVDWINAGALDN